MRRPLLGLLALATACTGASHTTDRPTVTDCDVALEGGLHRDPCAFDVECGRVQGGSSLRSAVCDDGVLLTAVIEQTERAAVAACAGAPVEAAGVTVAFEPAGLGCVDVEVCDDAAGTVRDARVCQVGAVAGAGDGSPWAECELAVRMGADGDACAGSFACIVERSIGVPGIIPVLGWCDGGVLRLSPSQTLLFGPPS